MTAGKSSNGEKSQPTYNEMYEDWMKRPMFKVWSTHSNYECMNSFKIIVVE
jgi:hypothetical protein